MSLQNDERTITILRIISQANLGGDRPIGLFKNLNDIIEEMGDKHTTKQIIDNYLLPMGYVRRVDKRFKELKGHELGYKAYQITEHGRTKLNSAGIGTNISVGDNVNLALNSPNTTQNIKINELDQDLKDKIIELQKAIAKKDKSTMKKVFGYIADKSVDVAIAVLSGKVVV